MNTPRFNDYREIIAKFDSTASCGHPIQNVDLIGWARRHRQSHTQCAHCWKRWVAENREADAIEAGYMNSCW